MEVVAGIALAGAALFGAYKLRGKIGVKECLICDSIANSKCAKCGMLTCANCSGKGCKNCGSKQFVRL